MSTRPELDLLADDVEEDLRASVRGVLDRACPPERVTACYDDPGDPVAAETWTALACDLGLAGLLVPESAGGVGASAREAAAVLEEIGRSVAPVPFLTSAVVATSVLLAAGDDAFLPRLAAGEQDAVLLVPPTAHKSGESPFTRDSDALTGSITTVGLPADVLVVPVDGALHAVPTDDPAVTITPVVSLDMTRPLTEVRLDAATGTLVSDDARAAVDHGLRVGAGLLASEQVGVAGRCLDTTVAYLKQRRQFGRVVGGFQALKHRLADLYTNLESARAAVRYAAAALAADDPDQDVAVAVAQSYCADVAVHAAEEAVQLHGGIGMTWEHPAHLYLKRAKADQLLLGSPEAHRAALADLLDLPAPA